MNRSYLLLIILCAIIACRKDQKPVAEKAPASLDFKQIKAPLPFAGSWISEIYLKDIQERQSPRKAQENIEECFARIPASTLQPATMVYNFHEAITDLIPLNNNGNYELWEQQNDTIANLKYPIAILAEDKIKIGDKTFVKINTDYAGSQPRILEEILFKGLYQPKKGAQVEFKSNGEVSGLGKYKYYNPVMDYFDAGLQIDQVGLGETRDKMTYFGFKFKKHGLELFELKCKAYDETDKARCVDVDFGKKIYDLEKVSPPKQ